LQGLVLQADADSVFRQLAGADVELERTKPKDGGRGSWSGGRARRTLLL
jgi:hypothetical protein